MGRAVEHPVEPAAAALLPSDAHPASRALMAAAVRSTTCSLLMWLMDYFATPRSTVSAQVFPEFTPRDHEILHLIAQHLTNAEIVARLSLCPKTVRNIASRIFTKLQVTDRAVAIMRARKAELGPHDA